MQRFVLTALLVSMLVLVSCGGSSQPDNSVPSLATGQQPEPPSSGLPALADLTSPAKGPSIFGPGWFTIGINDPTQRIALQGNTGGDTAVSLDAAAEPAWAIFGINGFTGDAKPTSARTIVNNVTGQYWLGFSDYVAGSWAFAGPFTDNTSVEIPGVDGYTAATAFVSDGGTCFVAVVVEEGGGLDLDTLELGVDGGSAGPDAPDIVICSTGSSGILADWDPSTSYGEPDFAGYIVERSEDIGGSYTSLTPVPVKDHYLIDATVTTGISYVYRVAAVDASGNRSSWSYGTEAFDPGAKMNPVAVLEMPRGPLSGPAEVEFDFSDSFQQDGETITTYTLDMGNGDLAYEGPDSGPMTLTIQPGCYNMRLHVTDGPREGETLGYLKVYPQWEPTPQVICEDEEVTPRTLQFRQASDPIAGTPVTFFFDHLSQNLIALPGGAPHYLNLGLEGEVVLGEPLLHDGEVLLPVTIAAANPLLRIAAFDGTRLSWRTGGGGDADTVQGAVCWSPEYEPFGVQITEWIGSWSLLGPPGPFGSILLISDLDADSVFDILYNPVADAFDIVYSKTTGTWWTRLSLTSGVIATAMLSPVEASFVDLEVNPAVNRPSVVLRVGNFYVSHQLNDDDATWANLGPFDIALPNKAGPFYEFIGADLVADDDTLYFYFGREGGTSMLYVLDDATWNLRNEFDYSGTYSGYGAAILPLPGGDIWLTEVDDDYIGHFVRLYADGTQSFETRIDFTEYLGLDLHGVGGTDGLHLVWWNYNPSPFSTFIEHWTRDGAGAWVEQPRITSSSYPDLTSNFDGWVYLSHQEGSNALLDYWDGVDWINLESYPVSGLHRPALSAQPLSNIIYWLAYDDDAVPEEFLFVEVENDAVLWSIPHTIDYEPIWLGTINIDWRSFSGDPSIKAYARGGTVYNASFGEIRLYDSFNRLMGTSGISSSSIYCGGRILDCSSYATKGSWNDGPGVYWCSEGPDSRPVRIIENYRTDNRVTNLEKFTDQDPYEMVYGENRYTCSAGLAKGTTAVGLVAAYNGEKTLLEWDNWGEWEELELPADIQNMNGYELVIGRDGRWHIIFRLPFSGTLFSWSTL